MTQQPYIPPTDPKELQRHLGRQLADAMRKAQEKQRKS